MSSERQAVLLNAVPLLALAAIYLALATTLAPVIWRERRKMQLLDWAIASLFPAIGAVALVLGILVLQDRKPIGGNGWVALGALLLALAAAVGVVPRGVVVVLRWDERGQFVGGITRAREAEERVTLRDRELGTVAAITNALVRA